MGISRRILYKSKFCRKYKTNVYSFFDKQKRQRDRFKIKLMSKILATEKVNITRKVWYILYKEYLIEKKFKKVLYKWYKKIKSYILSMLSKEISKYVRYIKRISQNKWKLLLNLNIIKEKENLFLKSIKDILLKNIKTIKIKEKYYFNINESMGLEILKEKEKKEIIKVNKKLKKSEKKKTMNFIFYKKKGKEKFCKDIFKKNKIELVNYIKERKKGEKREQDNQIILQEGVLLSWFLVDVLKYLTVFPYLKKQIIKKRKKLWQIILKLVSGSFRSILLKKTEYTNLEQKEEITENMELEILEKKKLSEFYYDKTKQFILKIKSPRLFRFFFQRLQRRYTHRKKTMPFRLDIPFRRIKYKKETEKVKLYRLLRIIRRYYGNLSPKQFWNIRKVGYNKSKGSAMFNYILLFESRLDIFLVRARFFETKEESRLYISKGWITVNGKKIYNFKYVVNFGDTVSIFVEYQRNFKLFLINKMLRTLTEVSNKIGKIFPDYLEMDYKTISVCYIPRLFEIVKIPSIFTFNKKLLMNWGKFDY